MSVQAMPRDVAVTAALGEPATHAVARFSASAHALAEFCRDGSTDRGDLLTSPDRRRLLEEIEQGIAVLTAARADLLVAERDSGAWRGEGDATFEAWLGRTSRGGVRDASGQVRQADTLTRMAQVRDAAQVGAISMRHVEVLSQVAASVPEPVREVMSTPAAQSELLALARAVDASVFSRSAARWAARQDPLAQERGHQAQRAARFLHLAETPDGVRIKGLLDTMSGHRLRLALEAASPRPAVEDDRSSEQRRADALVALAEGVLTSPQTTSGAAVRPHVSFHLDAETWAGLKALQERGGATGSSEAGTSDAEAFPAASFEPATLDDGTPVPISELARTLCDCELTRVVIDATGVVVDLGRTQRTYTGAQRRAVIARDRRCSWPGCSAHARWGEVHHMRWWDRDGGSTSIDNGVLLCSFHHHEVHRRNLTITRVGPGSETRPPRIGARGDPPGSSGDAEISGNVRSGRPYVTYRFEAPDGRQVAPAPRWAPASRPAPATPRPRSEPA